MKSAIVTGAGAGIGEAISKKLSDNNYRVGMLDLNQDNVIEASKKLIIQLLFLEMSLRKKLLLRRSKNLAKYQIYWLIMLELFFLVLLKNTR